MNHTTELEPISVSIEIASKATGLAGRTLYDWIYAGKLESVKVGGRRLVLWKSLKNLINSAERSRPRHPTGTRGAANG